MGPIQSFANSIVLLLGIAQFKSIWHRCPRKKWWWSSNPNRLSEQSLLFCLGLSVMKSGFQNMCNPPFVMSGFCSKLGTPMLKKEKKSHRPKMVSFSLKPIPNLDLIPDLLVLSNSPRNIILTSIKLSGQAPVRVICHIGPLCPPQKEAVT